MDKIIAIIPARYASTRFPGKPLAKLGGREMILHVCDRVAEAGFDLAVATDDTRILECVTAAGYNAVMTSPDHRSGTDRVWEAYGKIGEDYDIIINVQGDEPFISDTQLKLLAGCFTNPEVGIATLCRPYPATDPVEGLDDPNLVKVVTGTDGRALLFSRNPIPLLRGVPKKDWPGAFPYLTHIGIYGYRPSILGQLTSLPPSPLEKAESLEQLRWLQAGFLIQTEVSEERNVGIDTPEDLKEAEKILASKHV